MYGYSMWGWSFRKKPKARPEPKPQMKPKIKPPVKLPRISLPARTPVDVRLRVSPNFTHARNRKVELIILHATAGAYQGAINWLCNGNRKDRTSAHYVISKLGEIIQIVSEADSAWHAGYGAWLGRRGINTRSIGIELENANTGRDPYPKRQLSALLWLCRRICSERAIQAHGVIGHNDVDPGRKTDPRAFPWPLFRRSLSSELQATG